MTEANDNTNTGADGNQGTDWKVGIPEEYHKSMERFVVDGRLDTGKIAKSYTELEKLDSGKVKIPDEKTPAEKATEFWTKVGKPEKPDDYEVVIPEGVTTDKEFVQNIKAVAHGANLTKSQMKAVSDGYLKYQLSAEQKQAEQIKKLNDERWSKMKQERGEDGLKEDLEIAKRIFDEFAPDELKALMTKDDIDKDPILVKMYAKIGRLTMDDTLVRGRAGKPPEKKLNFEPEFEQKYGNKGQS